jgi:O-antigen ligase
VNENDRAVVLSLNKGNGPSEWVSTDDDTTAPEDRSTDFNAGLTSLSRFRSPGPNTGITLNPAYRPRSEPGRLFVVYGRLLGLLLAGYLLFDKAFAYLHLPGTPLYVGEMVLVVGGLGALTATGYLRIAVRNEPVLTLLAVFFLWGLIRFLPGVHAYGINAVRDFALVYYCLFAFFTAAALARSPDILERLVTQLGGFVPWLLIWLPIGLILQPVLHAPNVPFTTVSILYHKTGDAAIAALIALGSLWLFPNGRSARSRAVWSIMALVVMALSATQNRGSLLAIVAGVAVGLAFVQSRLRLIVRAVSVIALGLSLAALFSLHTPSAGGQGRAFSASQLFANVASIGGAQESGNLGGTTHAREQLWSQVLDKQRSDGRLIHGYGFGPNLAYLAGGLTAEGDPTDPLRSPHNSHLDILARMGLVGFSLWIALWLGWYWRLVRGCRRLAERGLYARRHVAVLCLMVTTAIHVGSFFDPQLEGAQAAALFWTAFGIGVAVTSFRGWFSDRDLHLPQQARHNASAPSR